MPKIMYKKELELLLNVSIFFGKKSGNPAYFMKNIRHPASGKKDQIRPNPNYYFMWNRVMDIVFSTTEKKTFLNILLHILVYFRCAANFRRARRPVTSADPDHDTSDIRLPIQITLTVRRGI